MKLSTVFGVSLMLLVIVACAEDAADPAAEIVKVDIAKVGADGSVPVAAQIVSAGQPDAAALAAFARSGYTAVIDLRGVDENRGIDEKAVVEGLNMRYLALPIPDESAVSFENADRLDRILSEFDTPVLVHCGSGNRVGALLALRHSLAGADDAAAIELGKSAGLTGLEPVVRRRLADR